MAESDRPGRRRRLEPRIYVQPNGKYAVCLMVDGRPRFRTLNVRTISEARRQRIVLQTLGELPLSPRLTFAEVAARWLAEFEAKMSAGTRDERTLDLYRSQVRLHLLPRLGRRRIALITPNDVVVVLRELEHEGLSPWTTKRILGALSCVFTFALRRGYISSHPFDRLERDERPHPLPSDQRVLDRSELTRLFAACPPRYQPLLATGAYTGMRLSEVLALSWGDIDFAAGVIHVRYQLARSRRGIPPRRIPPKTRASVRDIPLLPQLAVVLRQHRQRSSFSARRDFVFATGHPFPAPQRLQTGAPPGGGRRRPRPQGSASALPRPAPHLRQPPDRRHPPRRRPSQPHPRPRAHEHDSRHLRAPVRGGAPRRRRPRRAREERVRPAARSRARAAPTARRATLGRPRSAAASTLERAPDPSPLWPAGSVPGSLLLDQDLTSRTCRLNEQRRMSLCTAFHGRYWARTSDPQLVDDDVLDPSRRESPYDANRPLAPSAGRLGWTRLANRR
jgi:integrase